MNKNWPNNCRVGYKSPFNLLKLIEIDVDLENQLQQFEGVIEIDEIVDL